MIGQDFHTLLMCIIRNSGLSVDEFSSPDWAEQRIQAISGSITTPFSRAEPCP
jgi:hypothetical protein